MKQIFLLSLSVVLFLNLFCQVKATTESGTKVTLYEDGTWIYTDSLKNDIEGKIKKENSNDSIAAIYKKPAANTVSLVSKINKTGIWYNPKEWRLSETKFSESSEYNLIAKSSDGYAMIINEKIELSYDLMKMAVLKNAQRLDKEMKITSERYIMVNGVKILNIIAAGGTSDTYFCCGDNAINLLHFGKYLQRDGK
jgi:hypothetical protein